MGYGLSMGETRIPIPDNPAIRAEEMMRQGAASMAAQGQATKSETITKEKSKGPGVMGVLSALGMAASIASLFTPAAPLAATAASAYSGGSLSYFLSAVRA